MGTVKNLSLRVPWHDRGWDGHVCDAPLANSSCLALKLIAEGRDDDLEQSLSGEAIADLPPEKVPPCLRSSASFLSRNAHSFESVMAYSAWSKDHKHILPRTIHLPAWGGLAIPYRWMLKESGFEIARNLGLEASIDREPASPDWLSDTSWIQGLENQEAMLTAFAAPLKEEESLVLFYATRTPLCDDERRVLLGAALLSKKHELVEYPYSDESHNRLRSIVWERPIQHSLRPAREGGGYTGGFVMPYQAVLKECERREGGDPGSYVAFVPEDAREQFSYGSEQVTHGNAAVALMAARAALEKAGEILDGPWARYIEWIDERLARLWKMRGPAPGLGVVLSALHPGFNGTLFALSLADELEENADPWPQLDAILSGKRPIPPGSPPVTGMLKKRWAKISQSSENLDRIKLLSRLELSKEQAERALGISAVKTLENPYVLFEVDRASVDSISFGTVDRGLYPGMEVAIAHPLPASCNDSLAEYDNEFRLRAACAHILEKSAGEGHTLLPIDRLGEAAAELSVVHPVPLDVETIDICRDDFVPIVTVSGDGEAMTVQLERYVASTGLIGKAVSDRLNATTNNSKVEWRGLVDDRFGPCPKGDDDENRARDEKADALACLAGSNIGALIGPAGTGKTTVLQLLLEQTDIVGSRIKLLAPTGKARVRLDQETGRRGQVQTVAQFLIGTRYDTDTGRYYCNPVAPKVEATTCIIDESSMLTEDMLAAIIEAIPQTCRLILVGDPYQLPPIGAGCPFVDIIEYLKLDHEGKGVGELNTPRRQGLGGMAKADGDTSPLARADVQLAAIFSGRDLPPGEDEIAVSATASQDSETVRYRPWKSVSDLGQLIEGVLTEELDCTKDELCDALEESIGAVRNDKGYLNFEHSCAEAVESWQLLSVNRNTPGGSIYLNRRLKERLRAERLTQSIKSNNVPGYLNWMRFTRPRGPEQIVYGDKVICVRNHQRKPWIYSDKRIGEREFIANGEIGLVNGQRKWGKKNPSFTHVELGGRSDRSFSFRNADFSEDGNPYLELAYAITVHKAQGSEFGSVILVLPAGSRLVSREMIYTALTRQKKRIWILHQGSFDNFLALRQYSFSDIAARYTNLLRTPCLQVVRINSEIPRALALAQRGFLEERLIHRTLRGEMVSSKNELAIANILYAFEREGRLTYQVEPMLPFDDGRGRWADFLIEANGKSWYWEHCGMLVDKEYRKRWEKKKTMYQMNDYELFSEHTPNGRLIVTEDGNGVGLDSQMIEEIIKQLIG